MDNEIQEYMSSTFYQCLCQESFHRIVFPRLTESHPYNCPFSYNKVVNVVTLQESPISGHHIITTSQNDLRVY